MSTPAEPGVARPVRLRNALCERCGYHVSGVELRSGLFVCPECGTPNRVLARPRPEPGRLHVYLWWVVRVGLLAGPALMLWWLMQ
ncbi:MAG: hypothetical protein KIT68_08710 [Phycisphaeraceae bacterium]|nr:hypothetical protein [Phycisphaeraceae bacterium]